MNTVTPVATPYDETKPGVYQAVLFKGDTPRNLVCLEKDKWISLDGESVPTDALRNATLHRVLTLTADSRMKDMTTLVAAVCGSLSPVLVIAAPNTTIYWIGVAMGSLAFGLMGMRGKALFSPASVR